MGKVMVEEKSLQDIANAIRNKTGDTQATYLPSDMGLAVENIPSGIEYPKTEYYEITADTKLVNGQETKDWTLSLIAERIQTPYIIAYILFSGSTPIARQFVCGVSQPLVNNAYQTYRWQNGYTPSTASSSYDSFVNVGDKYVLVIVKAELNT